MAEVVYAAAGTYTFLVPIGVTEITVHLRGGGGGGSSGGTTHGKGGGAGAYVRKTVSVTPGATHTIVVGAAGLGQGAINTNGTAGADSTFDTTTAVAKGGAGGTTSAGGNGGTAAASTGDTKFSGGNGSTSGTGAGAGGGGGGSGGSTGAGGNATSSGGGTGGTGGTSGAGTSLAGTGGANGQINLGSMFPGTNGAGGGGGASTASGWGTSSSNGGDGWALVEWSDEGIITVTLTPADTTWQVPDDVTEIQVVAVSGAGGSSRGGSGLSGPGGGGGARSVVLLDVTPGDVFNLQVGEGGAGAGSYDVNGGGTGEDSWFDSTSVLLAKGAVGKIGGVAADGVGDQKWSGGDGSSSLSSSYGGGGGGAAAWGADGGDAGSSIPPTGGTGDAAGKTGTFGISASGVVGDAPGGGPSGGSSSAGASAAGGEGRIFISYVEPPPTVYEQEGFRFRNDDGDEDAASWKEAQDTDVIVGPESPFRLRFLIDTTISGPAAQALKLQWRKVGDPDTEWRDVT